LEKTLKNAQIEKVDASGSEEWGKSRCSVENYFTSAKGKKIDSVVISK